MFVLGEIKTKIGEMATRTMIRKETAIMKQMKFLLIPSKKDAVLSLEM